MPFEFQKQRIPEVVHIRPRQFKDSRGFFAEIFKSSDFKKQGIDRVFVQVNQSQSQKGVVRGLHYQKDPNAQGKLVSAIVGEIYDVAVDIRKGSPTFGEWVGVRLNADEKNMLYIPEGFAHGFSVLSETAEVIYYCTSEYAPGAEAGLHVNDSDLAIDWQVNEPLLSEKDDTLPRFKEADMNFVYA
jgi:dTDP-4-dehydrorhamnose 3,5-epimerase